MSERGITAEERRLVDHVTRWGSDGYGAMVTKLRKGRGWTWGGGFGVKGPPVVFKRKRDAVASFEAFLEVLHGELRDEARARAVAAAGAELCPRCCMALVSGTAFEDGRPVRVCGSCALASIIETIGKGSTGSREEVTP